MKGRTARTALSRRLRTVGARNAISGYLFILPFIIGFLVFMVKPMIDSLYMSFCTVTVSTSGFSFEPTGFTNYAFAFTGDAEYNQLLVEEISRTVTNSLAILVLSFVVAVLLNQKFKGRTLVRAIFFLPVILSSGVLVGLETENTLLSGIAEVISESSPINITETLEDLLRSSGIGGGALDVVFTLMNSIYDIIVASGIQIIVFLSGLQNVPGSLYEAADVEGCTRWESFWKITFPMVSPLLMVNMIYTIIDFFMKSDNGVMERISTVMFSNYDFGLASAMSWAYFGVIILILALFSLVISKGVHYYE